jgi:hypothetical protein
MPTASTPPAPREGHVLAALQCTASVKDEEMRCRDAAPSIAGSPVIFGGQGVYVRLANSGTVYDSVRGIFGTAVTVENLSAQPLGTPDGLQNWGFRVFFSSGPTTTSGSGMVEVANPDGVATFTAVGQPFFLYSEFIPPQVVSHARRWEFRVAPGVEAFTFGVLVQGNIPDPGGILRWVPRLSLEGVIGTRRSTTAGSAVFIAWMRSERRTDILRSDDGGATWTESSLFADEPESGCDPPPYTGGMSIQEIWAADAWTVYVLENRWSFCDPYAPGQVAAGVLRSADGGRTWTRALDGRTDGVALSDLWGYGDDVYASGYDSTAGSDVLLHTRDGFQTYTIRHFPQGIGRIWGAGPNDLYRVRNSFLSDTAVILHSVDGGATWSEWTIYGQMVAAIWGIGNHVWAVGQTESPYRSAVVHSTDGGMTWGEPEILPGAGLGAVWGTAADNVYAAGEEILRYDGERWRLMDPWWKTPIGWPGWVHVLAVTDENHVIIGGGQAVLQGVR